MLALVQSYCHAVLEEVLARFALEKINLVAGSQSTVGAVLLANERPKQIGNIALMCPQGLTVQALGASGAERLREFKKRALLSFRQKPNTPLGDWRNGYIWLASERIGLRTRKVFAQQFSDGIAYDLTEPLRGLAAKQKTRGASLELLPGADDKLFPAQEIIDSLAKAGMGDVKLAVVPQAAHSSLAVRGGRPQLAAAIASVRQNNY
jgi:pimeloyl-ACP methyl ester carboxylesterase